MLKSKALAQSICLGIWYQIPKGSWLLDLFSKDFMQKCPPSKVVEKYFCCAAQVPRVSDSVALIFTLEVLVQYIQYQNMVILMSADFLALQVMRYFMVCYNDYGTVFSLLWADINYLKPPLNMIFLGTGVIWCQWSNPEEHGLIKYIFKEVRTVEIINVKQSLKPILCAILWRALHCDGIRFISHKAWLLKHPFAADMWRA